MTRPREIELDQQTIISMIPAEWSKEYDAVGERVRLLIANDLDPENANSEAYRDAQRERRSF